MADPEKRRPHTGAERPSIDRRVLVISGIGIALAFVSSVVAQGLTRLIGLFTNLAFYGRWSTSFVSPAENHLGLWVIPIPVIGAIIVGFMARFGSKAIRGHGIPEAMEQVLVGGSRIPARLTILKPLSAAISIGTGGPFGAEGPIIATGSALGSLIGQLIRTTASERKTLLACGAAAGMAATFGSPLSAVLLAVELLVFEYRPHSLIPIALGASVATAVRHAFVGSAPVFAMADLAQPGGSAIATYIVLGALVGASAIGVTRMVYAIEDGFERLPLHWMWWPALGGLVVGGVGYLAPRTMGVGYDNIEQILSGGMASRAILILCGLKFVSWSVSLGSGTSGGTLAPLFTIGGGLGALLGSLAAHLAPSIGIDPRIAALVGMAAMFAGASRAILASVVFAFETTRQPMGLLPLLGGCTAAHLVSCLFMRHSIMTEKIERRGVRVLGEYAIDMLARVRIRDFALRPVVSVRADAKIEEIRRWIASGAEGTSHQSYPVLEDDGGIVGVVTRRDLFRETTNSVHLRQLVRRPPSIIYDDCSMRDAADKMAHEQIGRLPVVSRSNPRVVIGIVTRSDIVGMHADTFSFGVHRAAE